MMKNLVLIFSVGMFISCGANHSTESEKESDPLIKGLVSADCLSDYAEKLDELLTVDLAAEVAGAPKDEAGKKYSKIMKSPDYHSVTYEWKSDRIKTVNAAGFSVDVPEKNVVELKGIKKMKREYFDLSRRKVTDEQTDAMNREIDKALEGKSGNEKINERLKKLDELGVDKETQKQMTGAMTGMFAEVAKAYAPVEGVGEAASWNSVENCLYVFNNGVEMAVIVNISADESVNKDKAVLLMRKLMEHCR